MQISYPMFLSGKVYRNQLQVMFGSLQRSSNLATDGKHDMRKPMSNPVVVSTIQTPYGKKRPSCGESYAMKQERYGSAEMTKKYTKLTRVDQFLKPYGSLTTSVPYL